ncbi:hypothetical protein AOLI_G00188740 [Acnodon oligacanthus]
MSCGGSERVSEALLTGLGFVSADAPGSPFSSDGQIIQQIFPAEAPYRRLRAGLLTLSHRQLQRPLPEEGGAHKGCRHLEPNTGEEDQAKQQVDEGRGRRGRKANKTGHYTHTVKEQHAEDCVSPLPLF